MRLWLLLALLSNFLITAEGFSAASFDLVYWKKILQYNSSESRVDGEKFFLSPKGKTDPLAELVATIAAFKNQNYNAGWFNYHPQCVFRERFRFLKASGLLEGLEEKACPEFEEWKSGLNADSVTLIFSSSYPNNPSSLFGHTLLRLNQKNKTNDLLDYAVAFSAVPEKEEIGVVFAFKGIFGGYKGLFEITKYYTKVNEYSNGESRDLIEYNLNMSEAELERLINHLWELYQSAYLDYFFADENCSAVLADLLSVAYKDDSNVNTHARWYYLPGEMIKHFNETPGRIKSVKYRPSLKKQLKKSWARLSSKDTTLVKNIIKEEQLPDEIKDPIVLDNIITYLNFTGYRTKQKLEGASSALLRKSLVTRAKLEQAKNIEESYDQSNRAEYAHRPQKSSFYLKSANHNFLAGFEIKQGYHDLMARDLGFDSFSQFDFGVASFIYDFKLKKFDYDTLTIVNLISLHEYQYYDPQLSWRAKLYSDPVYDYDCSFCHKHSFEALGGVSFRPQEKMVISFMGGAFTELSAHHKKGFRAGPILEASLYTQLGNHYKIALVNELRFDGTKRIKKDYYNKIGLRQSGFFSENNDYRIENFIVSRFGEFTKNTIIHQVSYGHYF